MRSIRVYIVCGVALAIFAGAAIQACEYAQEQRIADAWFSDSLRALGITSIAEGTPPRLAYARALAARDPILGISGADTAALSQAAADLARVEDRLISHATSSRDSLALHALYPTGFLGSLAHAETLRRAFVDSGSAADERAYRVALHEALLRGADESARFSAAIAEIARSKRIRFAGASGSITTDTLVASARAIEQRFTDLRAREKERALCLRGSIERCDPAGLDLPRLLPERSSRTDRFQPGDMRDTQDVKSMFEQVLPKDAGAVNDQVIALSEPVCLGTITAPNAYMSYTGTDPSFAPLRPARDIFFYATQDAPGATMSYLKNSLGISYAHVNPAEYYNCPDALNDLGRVRAIEATVAYARAHPAAATAQRTKLLANARIAYEDDAYAYMQAALSARPVADELVAIALIWKENAAGIDQLAGHVAHTEAIDIGLFESGAPFDISARASFLTHSAFASLFAISSDAELPLRIDNASDTAAYTRQIRRYSDVRHSVSAQRLLQDLEKYFRLEGALR